MSDDFYRAFEDRHRGSRELIRDRLIAYLPFVEPLLTFYPNASAVDLGCGRGEWLEVLSSAGFQPHGIDLDEGMLKACAELELEASQGEALAHLATLTNESQAIVSAFHLVEHISFEQLRSLVSEAIRVLKPGGLLIMETPNPENMVVATRNFYLDPTHQRPIPPDLLAFLPEYYGFARIKTIRLQEPRELYESDQISIKDIFTGVSPDYAVVAQKQGSEKMMDVLLPLFSKEFGVTLDSMTSRYDNQLEITVKQSESRAQQAEARAQQAEARAQQAEARAQQAEARAQQAEARAQQAEVREQQIELRTRSMEIGWNSDKLRIEELTQQIMAIYVSRSWKATAPLRLFGRAARWLLRGSLAWITFAPMSRPHRIAKGFLIRLKNWIRNHPSLKFYVLSILPSFPRLNAIVKGIQPNVSSQIIFLPNKNCKLQNGILNLKEKVTETIMHKMGDQFFASRQMENDFKLMPKTGRIIYIYVDYTVKNSANSGLERTARMLSRSILNMNERVKFVKWCDRRKSLVYINRAELLHLAHWNGPKLAPHEMCIYPEKEATGNLVDVCFSGNNWLLVPEVTYITLHKTPMTSLIIEKAKEIGLKTAFIFYDLTPLHRPELANTAAKHSDYVRSLLGADLVLPISEWSKRELFSFLKANNLFETSSEIWAKAMPLPAESLIGPRNNDLNTSLYHTNLILSVGNITKHKNQINLAKAFDNFCSKHPDTKWSLVFVGNIDSLVLEEMNLMLNKNKRIRLIGHVSDDSLYNWYKKCAFTAFPSTNEGFGLPIVESIWFGKPCICANFGAMAETGSLPGCVKVNTKSVYEIEDVITELISNNARLRSLCSEACSTTLETWSNYANKLLNILNKHPMLPETTLWIDVSELTKNDAGTGIQRVTRMLSQCFLKQKWNGYRVNLVKALSNGLGFTEAREISSKIMGYPKSSDSEEACYFKAGDIFLGLDLSPQIAKMEGFLKDLERRGVKIVFFVYDLIPALNPEYYPKNSIDWFNKWLEIICNFSDELICISQTTALEIKKWMEDKRIQGYRNPKVSWIHLGADFDSTLSTNFNDISEDNERILNEFSNQITFLMVGTIEPRKGHSQVLDAFDLLWREGVNINLIIIGKEGWIGSSKLTAVRVANKIKKHHLFGKKLLWLSDVSDMCLVKIYKKSTVLIAASYAEGFGLPLIEANRYGIHVFARDIPIFREIVTNKASFFKADNGMQLAERIKSWIKNYKSNQLHCFETIQSKTWDDCANEVFQKIKGAEKV
jgi:O-antigen chain-terminating methyltransferase